MPRTLLGDKKIIRTFFEALSVKSPSHFLTKTMTLKPLPTTADKDASCNTDTSENHRKINSSIITFIGVRIGPYFGQFQRPYLAVKCSYSNSLL
jgi:hypothetical protein